MPWKFGLNKFPSDGRLNEALGGIGTIASIYLFVYYFISSFTVSDLFIRVMKLFSIPIPFFNSNVSIPSIAIYLIIINIIGFIVYILDYTLYNYGLGFYSGSDEDASEMSEYIMTLLIVVDVLGGMVGKLLAVMIIMKRKFYKAETIANYNLYLIPICFLASWLSILFTFFFPKITPWIKPLACINIGKVPAPYFVLGLFIITNIVTMILVSHTQRFATVITPREKMCLFLGLIGGATGGYLSIKLTGAHKNSGMLINTLPDMMIMHAIILTCIFSAI